MLFLNIFLKGLSLGFRFIANLSAGHVLIDLIKVTNNTKFLNIIYILNQKIQLIFIYFYELIVGILQITIYLILLNVYIK